MKKTRKITIEVDLGKEPQIFFTIDIEGFDGNMPAVLRILKHVVRFIEQDQFKKVKP